MKRIWIGAVMAIAVAIAGASDAHVPATITADDGVYWNPQGDVTVAVGELVVWAFNNPTLVHNVASDSPNWTLSSTPAVNHPPVGYTFNVSGQFVFVCQVHPGTMRGTVWVGVQPTPTPTPTPTPAATSTPTATATVTPTATPSATATPSPTATVAVPQATVPAMPQTTPVAPAPVADTRRPVVSALKLKASGRRLRVTFRLSEPSMATVRVRRSNRVIKTATITAPAGVRTVTFRSARLTRGRISVEVTARDAAGNRSTPPKCAQFWSSRSNSVSVC